MVEFHFDFGVYGNDLTEEQASKLFDDIITLVEEIGACIGGGYRDYAKTEETTEDPS